MSGHGVTSPRARCTPTRGSLEEQNVAVQTTDPRTGSIDLLPLASYAREVRPMLPTSAFEPARSRALWIPLHYAIIATLTWALATGHVPWPAWPLVSLVIGCSMGGVTFVGHEALHGG